MFNNPTLVLKGGKVRKIFSFLYFPPPPLALISVSSSENPTTRVHTCNATTADLQ